MDDKRHKRSDWALWFGIACGVLVLYFGVYAALVMPEIEPAIVPYGYPAECWAVYANDRLDDPLRKLFAPANWIDRTLFPSRWPGEFRQGPRVRDWGCFTGPF